MSADHRPMRRRLTVAMVLTVATALLVTGLGTLLLVARAARDDTRRDLVRQAETVAQAATDVRRQTTVGVLRRVLKLNDAAIIAVGPAGAVAGVLPSGLARSDIRPADLLAGLTVSGNRGRLAYAAAPALRGPRGGLEVVVFTRQVPMARGSAVFFLLSAAVALAVAAVVANRVGHRVTRPLEQAEATTREIAAGDLAAKVTVPDGADLEVASLARSINSMAESLGRARAVERQFLMSVSHDLRTPLTSIRGFAEAIADGAAPDIERAAEVISAESRRLERLVGDLLELAKLDARRFSLDVRPVDLGDVVATTAEGFRPAADDAGVALEIDVPTGCAAQADPDRLAQVVANLVENALKYAASYIEVAVRPEPSAVTVVVGDDGPGIPADDVAHVFERLYQSTRTPARQMGSGLGLAIVHELVVAMGGTVRAESPPSGGTRMVVSLSASSSFAAASSATS